MLLGLRTAIYHVDDINQARDWYAKLLGFGPYFDEPFYVGFIKVATRGAMSLA